MILDDILAHKRDEVAARKHATPRSALRDRPFWHEPRRCVRQPRAGPRGPRVIGGIQGA